MVFYKAMGQPKMLVLVVRRCSRPGMPTGNISKVEYYGMASTPRRPSLAGDGRRGVGGAMTGFSGVGPPSLRPLRYGAAEHVMVVALIATPIPSVVDRRHGPRFEQFDVGAPAA